MSYRIRLILGILLTIAPILFLMTLNRVSMIEDLAYERELNRLNSVGQLLADAIEENLEKDEISDIEELLGWASTQPYLLRVNVIDSAGIIAFSTDAQRKGNPPLFTETEDLARLRNGTFVKSFPIHVPGDKNYSLQVLYSLTATAVAIEDALRWAVYFDLAVFVAAAVIAWIVSGFMERPVRMATESARRIAMGDFDVTLRARTKDAYGQLLISLNKMASDLKSLTHQMQDRIDAATAELVEKNRRLLEMDSLKSEFVAMVSHELRTPLTSIIGFARTLQRVPMDAEKRQECLAIVEKEGKNLASLIEEYLDITKIESGNFELTPGRVDLERLVSEVITISGWSANITIDAEDELPVLTADAARLRRVFRNLFENAIEYGGKDVAVRVLITRNSHGVLVKVTDNGPGIPEEEVEKIFTKFHRLDSGGNGTGLGLTLVKAIIEEHGGRIRCESVPGKGTSFVFNLPSLDIAERKVGSDAKESPGC